MELSLVFSTDFNEIGREFEHHMKTLRLSFIAFICILAQIPPLSALTTDDFQAVHPAAEHRTATQLIARFMAGMHYKQVSLNDALSARILDRYVKNLDPNRSYFLASDIARFDEYKFRLDNDIANADLKNAFYIFNVFKERMHERVGYTVELLRRPFDFTENEVYLFDRVDADWPRTQAELDEIWRQKIKNDALSLLLAGKESAEVSKLLKQRYEGLAKRTDQLNADDVFQYFMNAFTTSVEPHTEYFSPRESENFQIRMSLSLEGIGAVLQNENEYTLVRRIVPGGPADVSKALFAEDRIIGVGQGYHDPVVDVIGWRLDDVVELIRGPKGSVVRLLVLPKTSGMQGPSKTITLTRNKIELEEQAAKSSVIELPNVRIGVINVPTFYIDFAARTRGEREYRSTTRDVQQLLDRLKTRDRVDGIVVDLRGNGGGALSEANGLTGLFIQSGPIVQVKDATGRLDINDDPDPSIAYAGPLAVLVDRYSASASEIFAAAIQDYRRGIIIGEPTFGKGTVQNLIDLNRFSEESDAKLGQLKVTVAQFFRVNGNSTQHRGVTPDIIFELYNQGEKHGERAMENALPWAQIKPVAFSPGAAPIHEFAKARSLHLQRVKSNRVFALLEQQLRDIEKIQKTKTISLNKTIRQNELDQQKFVQDQRNKELEKLLGFVAKKAEANDEEEEDSGYEKDVLLKEAANILADLIVVSDMGNMPRSAQTQTTP